MLDSPLFKQIVTVQDSLQELGERANTTDHLDVDDFDFTATGELSWFQEGRFSCCKLVVRANAEIWCKNQKCI